MPVVRYGQAIVGRKLIRRRVSDTIDQIERLIEAMDESPQQQLLKRELAAIGEAAGRIQIKILGPHLCVIPDTVRACAK